MYDIDITVVQFNLSAAVSRSFCQIDDCSGCSCQQNLVCMLVVLHLMLVILHLNIYKRA